MKIVSAEELEALPGEVLYSEYRPRFSHGLFIRCVSSDAISLTYVDLIGQHKGRLSDEQEEAFHEKGLCVPADFYETFCQTYPQHSPCFLVYEPEDVKALIKRLQRIVGEKSQEGGSA